MAVAYAIGVLRDVELAKDVAQDAFVEAHDHLAQLRAPEAFSAWLRRILYKHCDRRRRRKSPELLPEGGEPAGPEQALERDQARAWIRAAVEGLPEHERVVVALHYLGESPQKDVAEFLELPLSTVKKRLHTARRRLEAKRDQDMQTLRPTQNTQFADRITLFLAMRAQDYGPVAQLLDRHPEWVNQPERWTREEALQGDFTLAHRLTPLLLAAGRGDLELVQLLLARGAEVDGPCGCDSQETPLLAAVIHGRQEVAAALLQAGADPNRTNRAGFSPLHIARMRGLSALAAKLEAAGADPALKSRMGRTPQDCVVPEPTVEAITQEDLPTGIKGLDLLAPLTPGMRVRVHGAADTGLMVLLCELAHRLASRGWRSVWGTRVARPWQRHELADAVAQAGLQDSVEVHTDGLSEVAPHLGPKVALFVFRAQDSEAEVDVALPGLLDGAGIAFVIDPWRPVTQGQTEAPSLRAPFDALICTDPGLAAAGIYPALDVQRTASRRTLGPKQTALQLEVRSRIHEPQVQAFLSQPFFVAQHDNGLFGQEVSARQTQEGFTQILAGGFAGPADALKYQGALPPMTC